jgi:hypothetical protein
MSNVPAPIRHIILLLISVGLAWIGTDIIPWLKGQTGWGLLAAALVSVLLAYFTPLVQAYGRGYRPPAQRN